MTKAEFPSLPVECISKNGFKFDPSERHWSLSRGININLTKASELVGSQFFNSFVRVLVFYAENLSASTTQNQVNFCNHFFGFVNNIRGVFNEIKQEDIINYVHYIKEGKEYYLGNIRPLFKRWYNFGFPGINKEIIDLIYSYRLQGNEKGKAVKLQDPHDGPLSSMEFESLKFEMLNSFEKSNLDIVSFCLLELFFSTGRRTSQIADLKIEDLVEGEAKDGLKGFILNVPRCKQKGVNWREQFKPVAINSEIGEVLEALCDKNKRDFEIITEGKYKEEELKLPIFPDWNQIKKWLSKEDDYLKTINTTEILHRSRGSIYKKINKIVKSFQVSSERTGKNLNVSPVRFRRTFATRAAKEGYGDLIIAELLDHSDTQNVKVYTENVPENLDAINKAVAEQLAPIAQAFAGVVVTGEKNARRGGDPKSRVRSEEGPVGNCGHFSFCGAFGPIACYTCQHFQPWVDGPHEEILEGLWAERERIKDITGDETVAAINDRTIVAVTEVVQQCRARLKNGSEE